MICNTLSRCNLFWQDEQRAFHKARLTTPRGTNPRQAPGEEGLHACVHDRKVPCAYTRTQVRDNTWLSACQGESFRILPDSKSRPSRTTLQKKIDEDLLVWKIFLFGRSSCWQDLLVWKIFLFERSSRLGDHPVVKTFWFGRSSRLKDLPVGKTSWFGRSSCLEDLLIWVLMASAFFFFAARPRGAHGRSHSTWVTLYHMHALNWNSSLSWLFRSLSCRSNKVLRSQITKTTWNNLLSSFASSVDSRTWCFAVTSLKTHPFPLSHTFPILELTWMRYLKSPNVPFSHSFMYWRLILCSHERFEAFSHGSFALSSQLTLDLVLWHSSPSFWRSVIELWISDNRTTGQFISSIIDLSIRSARQQDVTWNIIASKERHADEVFPTGPIFFTELQSILWKLMPTKQRFCTDTFNLSFGSWCWEGSTCAFAGMSLPCLDCVTFLWKCGLRHARNGNVPAQIFIVWICM